MAKLKPTVSTGCCGCSVSAPPLTQSRPHSSSQYYLMNPYISTDSWAVDNGLAVWSAAWKTAEWQIKDIPPWIHKLGKKSRLLMEPSGSLLQVHMVRVHSQTRVTGIQLWIEPALHRQTPLLPGPSNQTCTTPSTIDWALSKGLSQMYQLLLLARLVAPRERRAFCLLVRGSLHRTRQLSPLKLGCLLGQLVEAPQLLTFFRLQCYGLSPVI